MFAARATTKQTGISGGAVKDLPLPSVRPIPSSSEGANERAGSKKDSSNVLLRVQPKLTVGAVDDPLEREADSVANQVVQQPSSAPAVQARFSTMPGGRALQPHRAPTPAGGPEMMESASALVSDTIARPGRPLDGASRAFFESHFGCDFSAVRVHADAASADSARALNASAYTVGQSIAFGEGKFSQHTQEGRRLLAHELTHVVQQNQLPRAGHGQTAPAISSAGAAPSVIQRAPPGPPTPGAGVPILGSTSAAAETESLFHYGDLTGRESLSSPRGYPRLTDCDIATSVEEAAKYTGTPVRDTVKYKYEVKIERSYFAKNFKNVGTRSGYSEFGTDQPIPIKYFRRVATLLRGPAGGAGPVAGGGGAVGGGTTGGGLATKAPLTPKPGALGGAAEAGVEGGAMKSLPKTLPGGAAEGAVGGAVEGAVEGAALRAAVGTGLRFLGGAAIGAAIGIVTSLLYSYLTRKMILADITNVLENIPQDRQNSLQARINALPAGKKKLARVTLDYTMYKSTLGFLGGPDTYLNHSVILIGVHPGNEELDFPSATEETLGQKFPALATQEVIVRISYTVPIE